MRDDLGGGPQAAGSVPAPAQDGTGRRGRPGHVFVVRGRLEHLDCDAVVVPTWSGDDVREYWEPVLGPRDADALRPPDWERRRFGRAGGLRDDHGPPVWLLDFTGRGPEGLAAAAARLRALLDDVATAGVTARNRRARPLVALPVLGVRGGGFDAVRGRVLTTLLDTADDAARQHGLDVVLVADRASDHAALQSVRRTSGRDPDLPPRLLDEARRLAARVRSGDVALFLGAGVSMSAGSPSWGELLDRLQASADLDDAVCEAMQDGRWSALDRAQLLRARLGDRFEEVLLASLGELGRYGLSHALVASLGCREVVTTNYDRLYEKAVRDVVGRDVATLPWDDVEPGAPWVLKMHGDVDVPGSIVLTRSDFATYDASSRPMGSLVQSLMITRHLLVIGASLNDDNFLRLAHEVVAFQRRSDHAPEIGTVVTLDPDPARVLLWEGVLHTVVAAGDADDRPERARDLAVFLDALAMHTSSDASWLADERYASLLRGPDAETAAEQVRDLAARAAALAADGDGPWAAVARALGRFGPDGGLSPRTSPSGPA